MTSKCAPLRCGLTRGLAGLVLLGLVTGCVASDTAGRRAAAADGARAYFDALANSSDLGWSLIDQNMGWSDIDAYRTAAQSSEWDTFEVTVVESTRCDEGYACRVCLDVAQPDDVPDFLLSSDGRAFDGIILLDDPLPCGNAILGAGLHPLLGSFEGVWVGPQFEVGASS